MNEPIDLKYSILIPAYKSVFLSDCLDSCLDQKRDDYEILILDDASPEHLDDIVRVYDDHRIRYIRNSENIGAIHLVDNWNTGLRLCRGRYIICMGDDDMLSERCLELYDSLIGKYPDCDVYHMRTQIIDDEGAPVITLEERPEQESAYAFLYNEMKGGREQFIGDFLFHRDRLIENGGFSRLPLGWFSDRLTVIKQAYRGGIANCNEIGFKYRRSEKSISGSRLTYESAFLKVRAWGLVESWLDKFLNKGPEDETDTEYYRYIKNNYREFIKYKKREEIRCELQCCPQDQMKWFYVRKRFGLNAGDVLLPERIYRIVNNTTEKN
ncbi:MAG: glycosyltransferase family 2 protein [Lachnospiraceae bacterium]|nr:glycosyltransferase family 2 protein [Lachnospiraceae bacterium]